MGYIYKITNKINGKVYIGKTLSNIEDRWKEHLRSMNNSKESNRPLYNAMNKYGIDNFEINIIEECTADQINIFEQYWIEKYRSYVNFPDCNGYNATLGGDGSHYTNYKWIYELWQEGKTQKTIREITKYDSDTILRALINYGVTKEERELRKKSGSSQKVAMLDINTEEIIKIFNSQQEAARYLGKNSTSGSNIGRVCNGGRPTAFGHKWKHIDE